MQNTPPPCHFWGTLICGEGLWPDEKKNDFCSNLWFLWNNTNFDPYKRGGGLTLQSGFQRGCLAGGWCLSWNVDGKCVPYIKKIFVNLWAVIPISDFLSQWSQKVSVTTFYVLFSDFFHGQKLVITFFHFFNTHSKLLTSTFSIFVLQYNNI